MPEFVITIVVVVIAAVIAVVVVARLQRRSLRKMMRLAVVNQGNVWSRYELKAEDPTGILKFEFTMDGDILPEGAVYEAGQAVEARAAPQPTPQVAAPSPPQPPEGTAPPAEEAKKAGQAAAQAKDKAKAVLGLSGAIAGLLGTLGMILPRSIGSPMLQAATRMRRGQSAATRVEQAPRRVSGQMKKVKSASSAAQQAPAAPQVQPPAVQVPQQMPAAPAAQSGTVQVPQQVPAAQAAGPGAAPVAQTVEPGWVQTPSVQPGETLALDLLVKGARSRTQQQYDFSIISRSVEQGGTPLVREEGSIEIRYVPWILRALPYFAIIIAAIAVVYFTAWLMNIGIPS